MAGRKDKIKDKVKKDKRFKDKTPEEQQDIIDFVSEEIAIRLDIIDFGQGSNPMGNLIP